MNSPLESKPKAQAIIDTLPLATPLLILQKPEAFSQQTQAQRADTIAKALTSMFSAVPILPTTEKQHG